MVGSFILKRGDPFGITPTTAISRSTCANISAHCNHYATITILTYYTLAKKVQ